MSGCLGHCHWYLSIDITTSWHLTLIWIHQGNIRCVWCLNDCQLLLNDDMSWHRNLQIIDKSHLTQIVCIKCLLARYPGLYSLLSSDWLIQRLHALHWECECLDKCCHCERLTIARLLFWILDSWSLLVHPKFLCNTFTQDSEQRDTFAKYWEGSWYPSHLNQIFQDFEKCTWFISLISSIMCIWELGFMHADCRYLLQRVKKPICIFNTWKNKWYKISIFH